ncbi:TldE/PmbA family protein [Ectothiorhodospiraceae bacterium 2226]|nr:TldE/PmbA family protein [Ectothiorhodospiraceae bacterium 2226]
MQDHFFALADFLTGLLQGDERYTLSYGGESSDFVRFNRGRVRQCGHVEQGQLQLDLISGQRHAGAQLTLAADGAVDRERLAELVRELREVRAVLPEDPHLFVSEQAATRLTPAQADLPPAESMVDAVLERARGDDLVGVLAAGPVRAGFANSFGQRAWHTRTSFNLDWTLYAGGDKAAKERYAGAHWAPDELTERMDEARRALSVVRQAPLTLAPGRYRAYLAPQALEEIVGMLGWGGFGLRAQRTKTTPLLRLTEGETELHPAVTLVENTEAGLAPPFQAQGFARPPRVVLIEHGKPQDALVSPRSAREFDVAPNGADESEMPLSLEMAGGSLPRADVLRALDTGLYISNLWYLNWSDRNAARLTGMTRFATYWVERGRIQAPVNVMRFDDSVYRLLGEGLMALTQEREWLLDPQTYGSRSLRSMRLPGALVDGMQLTL